MEKTDQLLTRGVEKILPDKKGLQELISSQKVRVYLGIDPTGSRLHLGHTIPLRKLNEFAQAGHTAILLFGTGTVLAGDPSQRLQRRIKITQEEIDENIKTWKAQAGKVVDLSQVQVRQNGDWLLKLNLAEIINIASNISATQLFKRDMFQRRIDAQDTVYLHETLYPMLQGYDSVVLNADLEIGGTDQTFNMLVGRELQRKMNNRGKYVLTTPLINGTDGKPMSKTSGNCIWLDDSPGDMFGKIMTIDDGQIVPYWQNLTRLPQDQLVKLKPLEAKKTLAHEIVKMYHDKEEAQKAEIDFGTKKEYLSGGLSSESFGSLPTTYIDPRGTVLDVAKYENPNISASEVKSLVRQGAIDVNFNKVTDVHQVLEDNQVVRIGKKKIFKVKIKNDNL